MSFLFRACHRAAALIAVAVLCSGCWGDEIPALDRIGAVRSIEGDVVIRFDTCPGERVERVVVNRTDDDFEEIEGVLWEISLNEDSDEGSFTVGDAGEAAEVTALDAPLQADDNVHVMVSSSELGTIPMSFTVGDVRADEVLVRDRYRDTQEFAEHAREAC